MQKRVLHLDFETRSTIDLKKCGLHRYANPNYTQVLVHAWAFDDGPVHSSENNFPEYEVVEHIYNGGEVWAHNAPFEIAIWNNVFGSAPNVILRPEQTICTMAMVYAMALPGSLGNAAEALGIIQQKDREGYNLMMQMCKPSKIKEDGTIVWKDDAESLKRLAQYCRQDVETERELGYHLRKLSQYEKRVWILDQKVNDLGITVDRKAAKAAIKIVKEEKDRLNFETRRSSIFDVERVTTVSQLKKYLVQYGIEEDSLGKAEIIKILSSPVHEKAKEILKLRQQGGKSATSKLNSMLEGTTEQDPRLKGCFQYSGANTRRWSGRRVQLQNLKRPSIKQDQIEGILEGISSGLGANFIDTCYGPPINLLGDCTRGFLTAAAGQTLLACDYSAIEARVIAWLAGQKDVLDIFSSGFDIYLKQASDIFGEKIEDKEDPRRMIGKVAILALGYQGGVGALQTMAKAYNCKMEPAFDELWRKLETYQQDWVEKRWQDNKKNSEISEKEWKASEIIKMKWRETNPKIVQFWSDCENAFKHAIQFPEQVATINDKIAFKQKGNFVFCRLPSNGQIVYPFPRLKETETPWKEIKSLPSYASEDGPSKKWMRFTTYGGSIAENITQAVARDILADAMLRLDENKYRIVLHIHDEIVCETSGNGETLADMKTIMSQPPEWAKDLPIAVSGWQGFRYRK